MSNISILLIVIVIKNLTFKDTRMAEKASCKGAILL